MSEVPRMDAPPPETGGAADRGPVGGVDALAELVGARVGLMRLEGRVAMAQGLERLIGLAAALWLAAMAWALLVAGGVAAVAWLGGWRWPWVALAGGLLHAVVAALLLRSLRAARPAAFPFTREEFKKDFEWIKTLRLHRK